MLPVAPCPGRQVGNFFPPGAGGATVKKAPRPGRSAYGLLVKPLGEGRRGNNLEHAFYIDGFRTPGIEHPIFGDGLHQGAQVMFAMQFEEDIVVEIHEDHGNGSSLMANAAVADFEFMGRGQDARNPLDLIQAVGEIEILGYISQGLLLGHNGDDARPGPLSAAVFRHYHAGKPPNRTKQRVVEIQLDPHRMQPIQCLPSRLGDFLRNPLVVPASRAAQVSFRMITEKIFQRRPPRMEFEARGSKRIFSNSKGEHDQIALR